MHSKLEFNQSQWLKHNVEFNTPKRIEAEKNWSQRWKSNVQINEQCCIWKNNGKFKKQNRCNTCKQQERLLKMSIQTKLYFTKNI